MPAHVKFCDIGHLLKQAYAGFVKKNDATSGPFPVWLFWLETVENLCIISALFYFPLIYYFVKFTCETPICTKKRICMEILMPAPSTPPHSLV
jgi:hypothetical protein